MSKIGSWLWKFITNLLAIFCLLSLGCSGEKTYRLCYISTLSGKSYSSGVHGRNGMELAIHHFTQTNNLKVELISKDYREDITIIPGLMGGLVRDKVKLVIANLPSSAAQTLLSTIKDEPLLVLSAGTSTSEIAGIDDNFIRTAIPGDIQGEKLAELIRSDGYTRVACVYEKRNRAYTGEIIAEFKATFLTGKQKIIFEDDLETKNSQHYLEIAQRIVDTGCQAVVISANGIDSGEIIQQLKKIIPGLPVYGSSWLDTADFITHGGRFVEGTKIISGYEAYPRSRAFNQFAASYSYRYRTEPSYLAAYTYETTIILLKAISACGTDNPKRIKEWILQQGTFQGLEEELHIDSYGDTGRSLSVFIVKDGATVLYREQNE